MRFNQRRAPYLQTASFLASSPPSHDSIRPAANAWTFNCCLPPPLSPTPHHPIHHPTLHPSNALKYAAYPIIRDTLSSTHDGEAGEGVGAMVAASMMSGAMGYAAFGE